MRKEIIELIEAASRGEITPEQAADQLLERIGGKRSVSGELSGKELTKFLSKIRPAKTADEKAFWKREYMRGFYGDNRGDYLFKVRGHYLRQKRAGHNFLAEGPSSDW